MAEIETLKRMVALRTEAADEAGARAAELEQTVEGLKEGTAASLARSVADLAAKEGELRSAHSELAALRQERDHLKYRLANLDSSGSGGAGSSGSGAEAGAAAGAEASKVDVSALSATAAAASMLKGMSLTEMYERYVSATEELKREKLSGQRLQMYMNQVPLNFSGWLVGLVGWLIGVFCFVFFLFVVFGFDGALACV